MALCLVIVSCGVDWRFNDMHGAMHRLLHRAMAGNLCCAVLWHVHDMHDDMHDATQWFLHRL